MLKALDNDAVMHFHAHSEIEMGVAQVMDRDCWLCGAPTAYHEQESNVRPPLFDALGWRRAAAAGRARGGSQTRGEVIDHT